MSNPFQVHITFYSTTPTPEAAKTGRPHITVLSGLRRSLALGRNFPGALLSAVVLRLLYGSPWNLYLRPVDVQALRQRRTMLEDVTLPSENLTRDELTRALFQADKGVLDRVHALHLWSIGADVDSGTLSADDVGACRRGELLWRLEEKRRYSDGPKGEVLPFRRGGPIL